MPARELITPMSAAAPVLSLAEAKLHLRVDSADEDSLITSLVLAAAEDAEAAMLRALLPQTWRQRLDAFPARDPVDLGPAGVTAITAITYVDQAGATQSINPSTGALLVGDGLSARLLPAYGSTWPATREQPGAVAITYTAGTWATPADVPELIKAWIKLRLGALYECREAWTQGKAIEPNPHIDRLLDRWCAHRL